MRPPDIAGMPEEERAKARAKALVRHTAIGKTRNREQAYAIMAA